LAYLQFTWRLPEQPLEAVVHVQLLEEDLHQRRRPPEHGGRGNRRTNGPRSNIPAPAFRAGVGRRSSTAVRAQSRGGTRARRRRRAYGRFCLGRLSTRGHGRSWDWRHSAASDCFTASAITSTPLPLGIAAFRTWRRGPRIRIRVGDTRKRNRRERPPLEKTRRPFEN
jgi:hypothetical protein